MAAGALEPPAGVTPDFGSKSYYMRTMVIVLLPVTSTFIFIRVYHKIFVVKAHNWEDCKFPLSVKRISLMRFRYQPYRVGKIDQLYDHWAESHIRLNFYQLGLIAFSVCVIQGERFGSGVHQWNVSIDHYRLWAQVRDPACILRWGL